MSPTQMGDKFWVLDSYVSKNNVYLKWSATSGPFGRARGGLSVNCLRGQLIVCVCVSRPWKRSPFSWPHPPQVRRIITLMFPQACFFMQNVTVKARTLVPVVQRDKRVPFHSQCFIVSTARTNPCVCDAQRRPSMWPSHRRRFRSQ